jgi:hypothetical protein
LFALCIIADEEFELPLYSDPVQDEVDAELWDTFSEVVHEILEGDRNSSGKEVFGDSLVAWRHLGPQALTFLVAVSNNVSSDRLTVYLKALSARYMDEVGDPRNPERDGVADVVVDVIPPWEDEEDWE